jgi:hypothetical protein
MGETRWVEEPFAVGVIGTPSGSDTLIRGEPLDGVVEDAESTWLWDWPPVARDRLACGFFSVASSYGGSGGESAASFSLSLEPFLDFLDCCWPMSVWAAGSPRAGDCDLDFESLEVNTERRVGASLRNGGKRERSGWAWERGRGSVRRKWQVRNRDKYDGVFGLLLSVTRHSRTEERVCVFTREIQHGYLELAKRLFRRFALRHTEHVEPHSLGQRSTLACTHTSAYTRFTCHSVVPTVTTSPISTRNAGETCTARFLCRFSYRSSIVNLSDCPWAYTSRGTYCTWGCSAGNHAG